MPACCRRSEWPPTGGPYEGRAASLRPQRIPGGHKARPYGGHGDPPYVASLAQRKLNVFSATFAGSL